MIRKAKREKKDDLNFYLTQGSENPTSEKLIELKKLPKEIGFEIWKNNYYIDYFMSRDFLRFLYKFNRMLRHYHQQR